MLLGPIFSRELVVAARRRAAYSSRAAFCLLQLATVACCVWIFLSRYPEPISVRGVSLLAEVLFSCLVTIQFIFVFGTVPSMMSGLIADEKQRKTLHYLMGARVTSAEIVLGKVFSRLVQFGATLGAGVPAMALLWLLGGVDPRLILATYLCTLTTALYIASFAILASVFARDIREAVYWSTALSVVVLVSPIAAMLAPVFGIGVPIWIHEIAFHCVSACSPMQFLLRWTTISAMGAPEFWAQVRSLVAHQLGFAVVFLLFAINSLRPVYRAQAGGDGSFARVARPWRRFRFWRAWRWRRRSCGDDAMLWKELRFATFPRTRGRMLMALSGYGLMVFAIVNYGRMAVQCTTPSGIQSGALGRLAMATAVLTEVGSSIAALLICGQAAASVTMEKERDTWLSLTATPLTGWELLRAKLLGPIYRIRWPVGLMCASWAVAVLVGAVALRDAFVAAITVAVIAAFSSAVGVAASLIGESTSKASGIAGLALIIAMFATPVIGAAARSTSPWIWTSCLPALAVLPITWREAGLVGASTDPIDPSVLLAWMTGVAFYTVITLALIQLMRLKYERLVGRPTRTRASVAESRRESDRSKIGSGAVSTALS